jgi:hypothetical protein
VVVVVFADDEVGECSGEGVAAGGSVPGGIDGIAGIDFPTPAVKNGDVDAVDRSP